MLNFCLMKLTYLFICIFLLPVLLFADKNGNNNANFFVPYKKNYLMPLTYDFQSHEDDRKHTEAQFQFSFMIPLIKEDYELLFGYTQRAFWQIYDHEDTRPFREIAHNPELFVRYKNIQNIDRIDAGYEHESNGEPIENSLSWNRLYLKGYWEKEKLSWDLKFWYWLKRPPKKDETDPNGDETPGIEDYLGYWELHGAYLFDSFRAEMIFRNNLNTKKNRGALKLELFGPFHKYNWYVQYWNGYGESLMDYRANVNRIGAGLLFTY